MAQKAAKPERHFLFCECGTIDHSAILQYWPDDEYPENELYLTVNLADTAPWWRRIALAVKYIFGWRSRYGHYTEMLLMPETVRGLVEFLEAYLGRDEDRFDPDIYTEEVVAVN